MIILFAVFIGIVFSIGQALGLNLGLAASSSKVRWLVMIAYYTVVQLGIIGLMSIRTISKEIKKDWIIFVAGNLVFLGITLCLESIQAFIRMIMILGAFNALVFFHSINISDQSLKKYIRLIIRLFYLVIAVAMIQQFFLLLGVSHVVFHPPRINSIFSDYNGFSGYLLSLIPLLWVLKKRKLVALSVILICVSNSATSIIILFIFLLMVGFKMMKKKRFFLKGVVALIIFTIGISGGIKFYTVDKFDDHPTNPFFKVRQMIELLNIEKIKIIKDNIENIDHDNSKDIIGLKKSSAVGRVLQLMHALFGWESIKELVFGFRTGRVEGTFLTIFIRYGLVGTAFYFYFYYKYFIFKTKNIMLRYYFWAFFIGVAVGLPLFSFPISMYIISLQIYVLQRLLTNQQLIRYFVKNE
ncbi:MAG: hypothetical protein ACON35_06995 [Candidatus Marinamargulisbacteria bacterium]